MISRKNREYLITKVVEMKIATTKGVRYKVGDKEKVRLYGALNNEGFSIVYYGVVKKVCKNYVVLELDLDEYMRFDMPYQKKAKIKEAYENAKGPCTEKK